MIRRDLLDDQDNAERWMVSYADFITLLFGFFVVMYAISSVNDEKYRVLSATLAEAFDVDVTSPDPIQVGEPTLAASPNVVDISGETAFSDAEDGDTWVRDDDTEAKSLLGGFADAEGVAVKANNEWLEVNLDARVLFDSNSATLSTSAQALLDQTLDLIGRSDNPVTIEGYTDNVPPTQGRYASNWELSAARASAVATHFVGRGVRQDRLSAVGYGENHSLATNATPNGRATNRRVVIVIARKTGVARNLNATPQGSAFAFVRHADGPQMDPGVQQRRNADGSLLFTNEAVPETTDESG